MENGKWKVIVLFNEFVETGSPDEEVKVESTFMYERGFADYYDMLNYVSDCRANGCVGGQVYRQLSDYRWEYYMEVI